MLFDRPAPPARQGRPKKELKIGPPWTDFSISIGKVANLGTCIRYFKNYGHRAVIAGVHYYVKIRDPLRKIFCAKRKLKIRDFSMKSRGNAS